MAVAIVDIYDGQDPRELPVYTYADASRYLGIPASTIAWWVKGRPSDGYAPVLSVSHDKGLTFLELVEIQALNSLRKLHEVKLPQIRQAVSYAEEELGLAHLLQRAELRTLGGELFISHLDSLVQLSRGGQLALKAILDGFLERVEWSEDSTPIKLFPSFRNIDAPRIDKPVEINPRVSFGRPTVAGTGIPTGVIAYRFDAGETIAELAEDYRLPADMVRSAVQYEKAA